MNLARFHRAVSVVSRLASSHAIVLVVSVWAACIAGGLYWTWHYKTTPGRASSPPAAWPDAVDLDHARATVIVALHPLCSCSHATISELARLMASLDDRPAVYALFDDYDASGPARLAATALWQRAAAIPGVTVLADPHGARARSFGAETSGDVIAYDKHGTLLFHGGLTAARGHEGDSFGRQRLLAALRGQSPDRRDSPVFGCQLADAASTAPSASILQAE